MLPLSTRRLLFLFFFTAAGLGHEVARAQEPSTSGVLAAAVLDAERAGTAFRPVDLFTAAPGRTQSVLDEETLLRPVQASIASLYTARPGAVSLTLHTGSGQAYTLQLLASHPTAATLTAGTIGTTGRQQEAFTDDGLHYQGCVAGDPQSLATLSVFASGEVMVLFANSTGNFVLGRLDDGSGRYVLYNDRAFRNKPAMPCGVVDRAPLPGTSGQAKTTSVYRCKKVRLYWECAYKVLVAKGGLTATRNYLTGLFNQVQALYRNDRIAVELASLYIWTAQDDYTATSSGPVLEKFRRFWNGLDNGFDGDLAMYLSRDNAGNGGGNGGVAYLDVLCTRSYAYGYADIYGTYQTVPTYSWDAEVITHEMGHNLGSNHTHWCGWNTGTGGACGAIDNCATIESTSGCSTCGSTYSNSAATTAWKGTIMSYCHLVSRGINLANGFGPLPAAAIQAKVSASTCLSSILAPTLTPTPICNGDGAVVLGWAANNFGTAPYTYSWNNGNNTTGLDHLSFPGTYTVAITDSNGCTGSFSTAVTALPQPGNGLTPSVSMPVCCENTSLTVPLRAAPATALNGCETVYWLQSAYALATAADAQAYFDTTAPGNILPANNPAALATAGAALEVAPPATCTGPVSRYYTPVVATPPRNADSIAYTASTNQTVYEGLTTVGSSVLLPDQRNQLSACYGTDTPQVQSLVVTATAYTGRANLMRIAVQDATGAVLYQLFGASGNGSYTIPAASIRGSLLQDLTITATDYNCVSSNGSFNCTSSNVTLTATRKAVYAARPLRRGSACRAGTSVRVDFAPTACTRLAVVAPTAPGLRAALAPNPASADVELDLTSGTAGAFLVTDATGRTLFKQAFEAAASAQAHRFSVRNWPKGVYFVTVLAGGQPAQSLKLVVD